MELELRHLKVVCAVSEAGSVTKAAATLGLAQPALTAQLNRIEKSLGGALFERDHRGVRSTPLGDLVLARAQLVLPAMSGLVDEAARFQHNEDRASHLSIGSSTDAVLGRLIPALAGEYDGLRVTTHASHSADDLAAMLADGRLDFAVVGVCGDAPQPVQPGLIWHTVTSDPIFVLLGENHAMAGRDEIDLAELAEAEWATAPGDGCFMECFVSACARAGFVPRTFYEADASSCVDLAASGMVVSLTQGTRTLPGLVAVPIAETPLRWRHLIGWHTEGALAEFSDEMVRLTTQAYTDLIAETPAYSAWLKQNPAFGVQPLPWLTPTV